MDEHRRHIAWKAGRDAYKHGFPKEACAYARGTVFFDDWHDGYEHAKHVEPTHD